MHLRAFWSYIVCFRAFWYYIVQAMQFKQATVAVLSERPLFHAISAMSCQTCGPWPLREVFSSWAYGLKDKRKVFLRNRSLEYGPTPLNPDIRSHKIH